MLLLSQCEDFPLTQEDVDHLLKAVQTNINVPDSDIALACVSAQEIQRLNMEYRKKNAPTNVLAFSYDDKDHDIAFCMSIAREEAVARTIALRDYVALLIVHALLHVSGLDHEESKEHRAHMEQKEREILLACGFVPQGLLDVY